MLRAAIIEMVKSRIDELSPFASTELNPSIDLIDSLLNDSDTEIRRKIPVHLISPSMFSVAALVDNGDKTGYIPLPPDFLRLHTFKMTDWTRAMTEAISEANPKYNLQRNSVTRGGTIKPVIVLRWLSDAASPALGCLQSQTFEATASQTAFVVTEFSLNDEYIVYVEGVLVSAGHARAGDVVIFVTGLAEGTEVVIVN